MTVRPSELKCTLNVLAAFAVMLAAAISPVGSHAASYSFTTIVDNTGSLTPDFSSLGQRKINDSGEVAFFAQTPYNIYKGSGSALTPVASSSFWGLDYVGNGAIANSGDVVYRAGPVAFTTGIHYRNGGFADALLIGDENPSTDGSKLGIDEVSVSNAAMSPHACANRCKYQ